MTDPWLQRWWLGAQAERILEACCLEYDAVLDRVVPSRRAGPGANLTLSPDVDPSYVQAQLGIPSLAAFLAATPETDPRPTLSFAQLFCQLRPTFLEAQACCRPFPPQLPPMRGAEASLSAGRLRSYHSKCLRPGRAGRPRDGGEPAMHRAPRSRRGRGSRAWGGAGGCNQVCAARTGGGSRGPNDTSLGRTNPTATCHPAGKHPGPTAQTLCQFN